MNILVPDSQDVEEYIDMFLETVLNEQVFVELEWDFI